MGLGKLLKKAVDPLKLHKKTTKLAMKTDPVAKKLMGTRVGKAVASADPGLRGATKSSGKSSAASAIAGAMKNRANAAATPKKASVGTGRSLVNERRRMK